MASLSDLSENIGKLIQQHIRAALTDLILRTLQTLMPGTELIPRDSSLQVNNGDTPEKIMADSSTKDKDNSGVEANPNPNPFLDPIAIMNSDGNPNLNLEDHLISNLQPSLAVGRVLTYKQALSPLDADFHSDMQASRKGEYYSVKIDDSLVQKEICHLQYSLIGRVSMAIGDSPYSLDDLKCKLEQAWGVSGPWSLVPLCKGYFNI